MVSYSVASGSISLAVFDHKQTLTHTGQNCWILISSDREDFFLISVMKRAWLFGWALWVTRLKLILWKNSPETPRLWVWSKTIIWSKAPCKRTQHSWPTLPTLLDDTYFASVCKSCYMLWRVVAICCPKFKTGQIFELTTSIISFVPGSPKRSAKMLPVCTALPRLLGPHTR